MNLEESDSFKEEFEKNNRNKKIVIISIVFCAILVVLLLISIVLIKKQDAMTLKMFLDDTQISIPQDFYRDIEGTRYVNVRSLSALLGYRYTKGEYGAYNEDEESCYLENDFEILAMSANVNKYSKYIQIAGPTELGGITVTSKNSNGYSETFKIEKPVLYQDGNLYAALDYVPEMFNLQVNWQEYRIKIYTLNYIVSFAKTAITRYKVSEISGYYENLRALLDGFVIVGNGTDNVPSTLYGVISLNDGKEIISTKYDDIVFIQNSKEFYITVANGTVGILNSEGGTVIAPSEFQQISLIDDEKQIYLVEKDKSYGVLDKNGAVIVYAENDEIGIDTSDFKLEKIENEKLLFGKCIPVLKDKKYALYNIYGDVVLEAAYDGLGYKATSSSNSPKNEQNVLIIPSEVGINGIVVNYNDLYGIYDVNAEELILPCIASKIFAITKSGNTTYYYEYNGETLNLEDWVKENNFTNIDENGNYIEKGNIENKSNSNEDNKTTDENNEENTDENRDNEIENNNMDNEIDNNVDNPNNNDIDN